MKLNFKAMSAKLTDAAGMVAGVAASRYIKNTLENQKKVSVKGNALIRLGAGIAIPALAGGKKSAMLTNFSNGMIADAATSLAAAFNMPGLSGTQDDNVSGDWNYSSAEDLMSGTQQENVSGHDDN